MLLPAELHRHGTTVGLSGRSTEIAPSRIDIISERWFLIKEFVPSHSNVYQQSHCHKVA